MLIQLYYISIALSTQKELFWADCRFFLVDFPEKTCYPIKALEMSSVLCGSFSVMLVWLSR